MRKNSNLCESNYPLLGNILNHLKKYTLKYFIINML